MLKVPEAVSTGLIEERRLASCIGYVLSTFITLAAVLRGTVHRYTR